MIDLISRYNLFDNVKKIGAIPETQKNVLLKVFSVRKVNPKQSRRLGFQRVQEQIPQYY